MDSVKHSSNKSRLARAFSKVLHSRAAAAAAAGLDNFQKTKSKTWEKFKHEKPVGDKTWQPMVLTKEDEKLRKRAVMDAFFAKLFADISSVKAAYAQLQVFQSPYDGDGIQSADKMIVSELKNLSELKQAFLKKHIDDSSPETTQLLAEIQEQKNQLIMYEITRKKLDNQNKLKESEIIFLKEKLEESRRENKLIEKRLNSSGSLSTFSHEILNFSSLTPTIFITYVKQTTKSVRSFVKFMISEMEAANWDLDAAASSIQPDVIYFDTTHICYAFESFVCRQMYDGFNLPGFQISVESQSIPKNETRRQFFFDKFMELKSLKVREYITWKPTSMFAEFCRCKYLKLVHPKMESSLFGNLNQRNQVNSRKFPETAFFDSFLEVSKRVWLLHCLAFSFSPKEASIFQITKGSRFSEVFMESVNEEAFLSPKSSPEVAFMVVPGFMVSKTVIQCQVYLI